MWRGLLGRRPRAPLPRLARLATRLARPAWLAWLAWLVWLPRIRPKRRPPPRPRLRRTIHRFRRSRLTIIGFPHRALPHIKIVVVGERFRLITGGFYRIRAIIPSGIVVKLGIIGHLGALSAGIKIQ